MSEAREVEVLEVTALESITSAEINQQIATAKKWPLDKKDAIENALELVKDEETAAECHYALPRGGADGDVEGASIRLAEILYSEWGNCRAYSRIVSETAREVVAQGVFHDLEKNVATMKEVSRSIVNKRGQRYPDHLVITTKLAAASIALRNAILGGIPKARWLPVYKRALATMKYSQTPLPERRKKLVEVFGAYKIPPERLIEIVERDQLSDVDEDDLVRLRGLYNALRGGGITSAEVLEGNRAQEFLVALNPADVLKRDEQADA